MRYRFARTMMLLMAGACGHGVVTDVAGGPGGVDTTVTGPGTVQRASFSVHITIDPTDAGIASTAGVTTTGITVRLTRSLPLGFTPQTAVTDADGNVKFNNLLDGLYEASVDRPLTSAELARLTPADRDASLFGGGVSLPISPPTNATREVSLVASKRGSLVISEMFPYTSPDGQPLGYGLGDYIEVYNNSDTTIYLDGIHVMRTPLPLHWSDHDYPCATNNLIQRMDSTAVYVNLIHTFPGSGREYPIMPGQAKVVAMDALDHRAAAPTLDQLDLSNADFEQIGSDADIDNPFVPNMLRTLAGTGIFGRGYPFQSSPTAHILALPGAFAASTLVPLVATTGATGRGSLFDAYRIPRAYVLDVMGVRSPPNPFVDVEYCSPFMSPAFERAPYPDLNTHRKFGIARKSAGRTADGREILQRTRNSARDFQEAVPLHRSLAK